MSTSFVPHKSQEEIVVKILKREAVLLEKLRRHAFGQFVVYKANGLLIRVEIKNSEMIAEDAPISLE